MICIVLRKMHCTCERNLLRTNVSVGENSSEVGDGRYYRDYELCSVTGQNGILAAAFGWFILKSGRTFLFC